LRVYGIASPYWLWGLPKAGEKIFVRKSWISEESGEVKSGGEKISSEIFDSGVSAVQDKGQI